MRAFSSNETRTPSALTNWACLKPWILQLKLPKLSSWEEGVSIIYSLAFLGSPVNCSQWIYSPSLKARTVFESPSHRNKRAFCRQMWPFLQRWYEYKPTKFINIYSAIRIIFLRFNEANLWWWNRRLDDACVLSNTSIKPSPNSREPSVKWKEY